MLKKKISLGITGGIGSGKTFVCQYLEKLQIPVFYTDLEARQEMLENTEIHAELSNLLGCQVTTELGTLNKELLSSYICQGPDYAEKLDAIIHPHVRMRLRQWLNHQDAEISAVECALLFESHFDTEVDHTILVTAPLEIRIKRVMQRDGKSRAQILHWISLQMPETEKRALSNYVIINDDKMSVYEQINDVLSVIRTI